MWKIAVFPFSPHRGDAEEHKTLIDSLYREIKAAFPGHSLRLTDPEQPFDQHDLTVLLILGGGTAPGMIKFLQKTNKPVIALALPSNNALAAALDVISIVRNTGRKAAVVQLSSGWKEQFSRHLAIFRCQQRLQTSRIGIIGIRDFEVMTPLKLKAQVQEKWGPELIYFGMDELISSVQTISEGEAKGAAEELFSGASNVVEPDWETTVGAAQIYFGLRKMVEQYGLDAVTVKCFELLPILENTGCYALARLNEEGIPAGCEGDVLSILGMLFLHYLTDSPSFMANPVSLDLETGVLHAAHCTIARNMVDSYVLRSHFESGIGLGIQGHTVAGPITIFRLGGPELSDIYVSDCTVLESTAVEAMCRTQWKIQIPTQDNPEQIIARPLGNHHLIVRGHWKKQIEQYLAELLVR